MPGRRASIPNSGNQFWQGDTAIGREPVVKIKKPSGIVRFSADFAKAFGVRRTRREWSELGSRYIGGPGTPFPYCALSAVWKDPP